MTYCQIYDIIFGKSGAELCEALNTVLKHPQSRSSVVELIACERWGERAALANREIQAGNEQNANVLSAHMASPDNVFDHTIMVDANATRQLSIKIELHP